MATIGTILVGVAILALFGWILIKGICFIGNGIKALFQYLTGSWFRIIIIAMIIGIVLVKLS